MARVAMTQKLSPSAETVWNRIGGFDTLHEWHPAIDRTEMDGSGIGAMRNLFLVGGGNVTERLDVEDAAGRSYTYSILSSPLPVGNYTATLRVEEDPAGGCTVHWSSTFDPAGASEAEAVAAIEGIYEGGFTAMQAAFGD